MDPPEQPQDTMNMTRALEALSPYLNHPRKTVSRIEVFVAVAATMLFLQLILGPWRRRSSHWLVQFTLWIAYTLSFPLIAYTLGQMISSPVKNALYPVWAVILFWASGCTNGITIYSLEDNKQWKRYLFELLQYSVYVGVILALVVPSGQTTVFGLPYFIYLIVIAIIVFFTNLVRAIAGRMVTNSTPSKLLADYMRVQVGPEPSDLSTMQVYYRYLVRPSRFNMGQEKNDEDSGITIKEIWDIDDSLLSKHGGGSQLKHVCLSFALSHLLRCRFFEMDCAEAGLAETHNFADGYLLSGGNQVNHYPKPFHIIEAILYLTSDWATVSLACSYTRGGRRGTCEHAMLINFHKFGKLLVSSSSKMFGKIINKLNLFGYWQNKMGQSSVIEGCLHVNMFNVIPMRFNFREVIRIPFIYIYGLIHSMIFPTAKFVAVPDLVKSEIVSCLRKYCEGGPLTNGEAALRGNPGFEEFSRTIENHSQTTVMLIWHIATEYCNIASSDEAEVHQSGSLQEDLQKDKQIATTLSKYCAYLMSFVPELLPGNSTDTRFLLSDVLLEGRKKLRKAKLSRDGLLKVINDAESSSSSSNEDHTIVHDSEGYDNNDTTVHIPSSNNEDSIIDDSSSRNNDHTNAQDSATNNNEGIFIKGLKLGRELEQKGDLLCWKVLAEFWVETIIYIAPSDKVEVHMERLAQGGEFLTHVWALLTHAGILKRDQRPKSSDKKNQTSEDIV